MGFTKTINVQFITTASVINGYATATISTDSSTHTATAGTITTFEIEIPTSGSVIVNLTQEPLVYLGVQACTFSKWLVSDTTDGIYNILQDTNPSTSFELTSVQNDIINIVVSYTNNMPIYTATVTTARFTSDTDIGITSRGRSLATSTFTWPYGSTTPTLQATAYKSVIDNANAYHNYVFRRWYTTFESDTYQKGDDTVDIIKSPFEEFTALDCPPSNITFVALFSNIDSSASAWSLVSNTAVVGDNIQLTLSPAIYVPASGVKLKFLLRFYATSGVEDSDTNVVTLGEADEDPTSLTSKLHDAWSISDITQPSGYTVTLPLITDLSDIFSVYNTGVSKISASIILSTDITETVIPRDSTTEKPFIDFSVLPGDSNRIFTLAVDAETVTTSATVSDLTFNNLYKDVPVAGISYFTATTNLSDSAYNLTNVDINYNGLHYDAYLNVGDVSPASKTVTATIGNYLIGGTWTTIPSSTDGYELAIGVQATNSIGNLFEKTFDTGSFIYGWANPTYTLNELLRCKEDKTIDNDASLNTCIYFRITTEYTSIIVGDSDLNNIETPVLLYGDVKYSFTKIASTNNQWELLLQNMDPFYNYSFTMLLKDSVITTKSLDTAEYAFNATSMVPLSLIQNDMGSGIGLGTEAILDRVSIGMDTVYGTNVAMTASKPDVSSSSSVTTSSYDLISRGGKNSVAITDEDIASGLYVNNIKIISRVDFAKLYDSEKDPHTMYIILK